jgi:hypothetical protein
MIVRLLVLLPAPDSSIGAESVVHGPAGRQTRPLRRSARRHAEALSALRAAPLQHQASVLRAHSDEESVSTPAAPVIRLKGALHVVVRRTRGRTGTSVWSSELSMVISASAAVNVTGTLQAACGTRCPDPAGVVFCAASRPPSRFPGLPDRHSMIEKRTSKRVFPREISTTVEKTVENRPLEPGETAAAPVLRLFHHGERGCGPSFRPRKRVCGVTSL